MPPAKRAFSTLRDDIEGQKWVLYVHVSVESKELNKGVESQARRQHGGHWQRAESGG